MVRLVEAVIFLNQIFCHCFNSSMVRLVALFRFKKLKSYTSFNSSMVRLVVLCHPGKQTCLLFQFQYGAIGSVRHCENIVH